MTYFYTLNTHRVNVLNLVPYHITEHTHNRWYGACRGSVNNKHPWLLHQSGDLELAAIEKFGCFLRDVNWTKQTDWLLEIINEADKDSKDLFFGTHDHSQFETFKKFFGSNLSIISLTYTKHDYDYLLDDLAKWHIHLLKNGSVIPNAHDQEVLSSKNDSQLIDHYKLMFDSMNYIPETCNFVGDYEIPFKDYFVPATMEKHFSNVGLPVIDKSTSLYHRWHSVAN